MANRSNVGNIVTNAQQIMSVGATTLAGFKAHWNKEEQDTVLNNIRQQEKAQRQAQSDAMYEQKMKNLSAKEQDILASVSVKQEQAGEKKAKRELAEMKTEEYKKAHTEQTPEEEFAQAESSMIPSVNSPQWDNVDTYVSNNVKDNQKRMFKYSSKPSVETPWYKSRKGDKE